MRAFTSLIVPASFILYAKAMAIEKRTVSAPVQLCVNDMVSVSAQVDVYNTAIKQFNRNQSYAGAWNNIHTIKELELEKRLKKAGVSCCVTPPTTFTTEEADAVLATANSFTPKLVDTLNSLVVQRHEFYSLPLTWVIYKDDIKNLKDQTDVVNNCFLAKVPTSPPTYVQTINGHIAQLETSFATAAYAYSKNTTYA